MKGRWMFKAVKFALFVVLVAFVFSFVVMILWNWLMPGLFGLHPIGFWQALGLLLLSKILLGGLRGRRGPHLAWRGRMLERWAQMSPEEREKFRAGLRDRCAVFGSRTAEPRG